MENYLSCNAWHINVFQTMLEQPGIAANAVLSQLEVDLQHLPHVILI